MNDQLYKDINIIDLKPDITKGILLIKNWKQVVKDNVDQQALKISQLKQNQPDNSEILTNKSIPHVISYLRYDLKKIPIRTRLKYVDDICDNEGKNVIASDIEVGFFEPLLICFSLCECLGYLMGFKKSNAREKMLEKLDGGYKNYSHELNKVYRNGLTHELRPHGNFKVLIDIGAGYRSPYEDQNTVVVNISHFIDSIIDKLESFIDILKSDKKDIHIDNYVRNISRINQKNAKIQQTNKTQ